MGSAPETSSPRSARSANGADPLLVSVGSWSDLDAAATPVGCENPRQLNVPSSSSPTPAAQAAPAWAGQYPSPQGFHQLASDSAPYIPPQAFTHLGADGLTLFHEQHAAVAYAQQQRPQTTFQAQQQLPQTPFPAQQPLATYQNLEENVQKTPTQQTDDLAAPDAWIAWLAWLAQFQSRRSRVAEPWNSATGPWVPHQYAHAGDQQSLLAGASSQFDDAHAQTSFSGVGWSASNQLGAGYGYGASYDTAQAQGPYQPHSSHSQLLSADASNQFNLAEQSVEAYQNESLQVHQNLTTQALLGSVTTQVSADGFPQEEWEDWNLPSIDLRDVDTQPFAGLDIQAPLMNPQLPGNDPKQLLSPNDDHHGPATGCTDNHLIPNTSPQLSRPSSRRSGGQRYQRIGPEAKAILLKSLKRNPYPSRIELEDLATKTNLDVERVVTWFRNARARRKEEVNQVSTELNESFPQGQLSEENVNRLLQIPPDPHRTISPQRIPAALGGDVTSGSYGTPEGSHSPNSTWSRSCASSIQSLPRGSPTASVPLSGCRSKRKGRRRGVGSLSTPSQHTGLSPIATPVSSGSSQLNPAKCFCTFLCGKHFTRPSDWVRHEETAHVWQWRPTWICFPERRPTMCPFCSCPSPDDRHLATHGYEKCANRNEEARTYYRKDNFLQHLHATHYPGVPRTKSRSGCTQKCVNSCGILARKWQRSPPPIPLDNLILHCGFCGIWTKTWEERVEHVKEYHFKGKTPCEPGQWWPARKPPALEDISCPPGVNLKQCRYCFNFFAVDDDSHAQCHVWSCRFVKQRPEPPHCDCSQDFFSSFEQFATHMFNEHGIKIANPQACREHYSRMLKAVFKPVGLEPGDPDVGSASPVPQIQTTTLPFHGSAMHTRERNNPSTDPPTVRITDHSDRLVVPDQVVNDDEFADEHWLGGGYS